MIGSLFGGPVLAYGRWNSLIFANIFIIIGSSITLIPSYPSLLIGKIIYGIGVGAFNVFVPKIVNEMSPIEISHISANIF